MATKGTYFIEKTETGWQVRQRRPGGAVTLCTTSDQVAAVEIQTALSIFPNAQEAAGELADGVADGPGQQSLVDAFARINALKQKAATQRELESCLSNLGQTALAIMAGVGTLIVIIWLIQFLLSH